MPAKSNVISANSALAHHLSIDRIVDAPRALVFKAWTEPEQLLKWCYLEALKATKTEIEVRTGGHWNIDLQMPDGEKITVRRVYREIVEPERIVFYEMCSAGHSGERIMLDGTHTIVFEDLGGKTKITVTCDLARPFDADNRQGWSGGWSELFDHLSTHLAKG